MTAETIGDDDGVAREAAPLTSCAPGAPTEAVEPAVVPAPLAQALRAVAASGLSPALSQQIERLFDQSPDRDRAVALAVRLIDQLAGRMEQLRAALGAGLAASGVHRIDPAGRFDPQAHEAVDTVPTQEREQHDMIAETVSAGYLDGDRVLRLPGVVVYRYGAGPAGDSA